MQPDVTARPAYRTNALVTAQAAEPSELVEVLVVWGGDDLRMASYLMPGERFSLSSRAGDRLSFAHPDHAGAARPLVTHDGVRTVVHHPTLGDRPLPPGEVLALAVGAFTFRVRRVPRSERLPGPRRDRFLGLAFPLALACTALVGTTARRVSPWVTVDDEDAARHYVVCLLRRNSARSHPPSTPAPDGAPMGGTGQRASGDEGAAGARTAPRRARRWHEAPRRGPAVDPAVVRRATADNAAVAVQRRGIFAALGRTGLLPMAPPTPGVHADTRATGNLYGPTAGDALGYAGLGLLGTGWGGGGHGDDAVGLGRIRTRGHGDDVGTAQGLGAGGACGCGEGGLRGRATVGALGLRSARGATVCGVSMEAWEHGARCPPARGEGLLGPAEIRRVVTRNLGQVRHCYERVLEDHPGAGGRLTLRWVIGVDGRVVGAGVVSDETGAPALGDCVASAVRRWLFPAPSGGVVTVNYPFTLDRVE